MKMHLSMMLRLTTMQQKYMSILQNPAHSLVVCTGPAGSGKTAFACKTAISQLAEKQVNQIVITKPLVSVEGEDLGFLPGNMRSKMSPWIESYLDIFKEHYSMKPIVVETRTPIHLSFAMNLRTPRLNN